MRQRIERCQKNEHEPFSLSQLQLSPTTYMYLLTDLKIEDTTKNILLLDLRGNALLYVSFKLIAFGLLQDNRGGKVSFTSSIHRIFGCNKEESGRKKRKQFEAFPLFCKKAVSRVFSQAVIKNHWVYVTAKKKGGLYG